MKIVFICLLILTPAFIFGQAITPVVGKWKVVAIFDEELYINLKTDSISYTGETEDSAQSVLVITLFKSIMKEFIDYTYVFGKDSSYQAINKGTLDGEGKFLIEKRKNIIRADIKRNNIKVQEKFAFTIKGNELHLITLDRFTALNLILERVNE